MVLGSQGRSKSAGSVPLIDAHLVSGTGGKEFTIGFYILEIKKINSRKKLWPEN